MSRNLLIPNLCLASAVLTCSVQPVWSQELLVKHTFLNLDGEAQKQREAERQEDKTIFIAPPSQQLAQEASPPEADEGGVIQVIGVQLNPTDLALEVILETADGRSLQAQTRIENNTLIADIPNAVLALPDAQEFRADNPALGILSISVTQATADSIQVTIVGETGAPTVDIVPGGGGLVLDVASEQEELEIVVTATRREESLDKVPRSVTVITREEVEKQSPFTRNLNDILTQTVPGFSPPTDRTNTFGFTLRGRDVSVLIDGIPQNSNLGSIPAQLTTIDPEAIERIEVVRGPNAIYGAQATGGLINIITRKSSENRLNARTELGITNSLSHFSDSFGYNFLQSFSGTEDNFDWLGSFSYVRTGDYYDADGDRIPTDLVDADTNSLNGLLKLGYAFDENQRLQFTFNYFDQYQNPDFVSDLSVIDEPGIQKARAIKVPDDVEVIGASDNAFLKTTNLTLQYSHQNLLGSVLQAQFFYRDFEFSGIGVPVDGRGSRFDFIFQSPGETEQIGGRLQIDTPFNEQKTVSLLWGVDFINENSSQTFNIFDPEEFDASDGRVFRKIDEIVFVPPYDFNDLGIFAQLNWQIVENLTFSGGARYVNLSIDTDDYTTFQGDQIAGGSFTQDDVVFNAGLVYNVTDEFSLFASFSQGFSFPDIGRVLRQPSGDFVVNSSLDLLQPQKVDNYELGIRGVWPSVQISLAGFFNYSDLGLDFIALEGGGLETIRAPQRVYGIEATLDWQPADNWQLGSSFTWLEGENDVPDDDLGFIALNSITIPPIKVTAYVENETLPGWRNRLQLLYVAGRDRAFEDGVDGQEIFAYVTLDYLSTIRIGKGDLLIGIQNLLNTDYFPVYSQYFAPFDDSSNYAGQGRTLSINYRINW